MNVRVITDMDLENIIENENYNFAQMMMRSLIDGDEIEFNLNSKSIRTLIDKFPNVAGIPFTDLLNKMPCEDMDDELFIKCLYSISTRLSSSKFRKYEINEEIFDRAKKAAEKSASVFNLGYTPAHDVFFSIRFGWLNYTEKQVDELIEICPLVVLRLDNIYIDKIEKVFDLLEDDERLLGEMIEGKLFSKIIDGNLKLYQNIKNDRLKKLIMKVFIYMYDHKELFSVRLYNASGVFNYMKENDPKLFKQCEVEFSLDPEEIKSLGQYILPF